MPILYAETPTRRRQQLVWDLAIVLWMIVWILVGAHVHGLVAGLSAPADELTGVGTSLASGADRIAGAVDDAPLVGGGLAAPFTAVADAAGDLADVARSTGRATEQLALWVAVALGAAPIVVVVGPYLLWRGAWVRRASEIRRLRDDPGMVRVLALRALMDRPLAELRAASEDPVRDLEERPEVLAELELRRLGLGPPA